MNIKEVFQNSLLSEASYADFKGIDFTDSEDVKAALTHDPLIGDPVFSDAQARDFVDHWQVISHQPDTDSGFSATLFQRKDSDPVSGHKANEYVYAIRGTDGYTDLKADLGNLALDGLAFEQIVDLYNDWQRMTTPEGQAYQIAKIVDMEISGFPERELTDLPSGNKKTINFSSSATEYTSGDPRRFGAGLTIDSSNLVSVTGHSLGGHLAAAFTRLFPGMAEAVTFNGAGFGTGNIATNTAKTNINRLFEMLHGSDRFGTAQNIYGDKNEEIITQNGPTLIQPGGHDALFIEQDSFTSNLFGHGLAQMSDSLAVYDLFSRLDDNLTLNDIKSHLEKVSNTADESLEKALSILHKLINGTSPSIVKDDREDLYTQVHVLRDADAFKTQTGKLTLHSVETLAAHTTADTPQGQAYRYALNNLNPFAITGPAALYAAHADEQLALSFNEVTQDNDCSMRLCA